MPWGELVAATKAEYVFRTEIMEELGIYPEGSASDIRALNRQPGRAGRGDLFYAERAAEYVELCASGVRAPLDALAKRHGYSKEAAKDWIKKARSLGFLTNTARGAKGGRLTEEAQYELSRATEGHD
jgi:hypothetical protein